MTERGIRTVDLMYQKRPSANCAHLHFSFGIFTIFYQV